MSPESEALVRRSWTQLEPVGDELVALFYNRLFESNPADYDLFASTDMSQQRPKFLAMIRGIMQALDNPQVLVHEVAASGRRHVGYGVVARDYEDVGAALIWAIHDKLGDDFTPEVHAAWREAYALVAAVMKRAAGHS